MKSETFSNQLKRRRRELGLTQEELAARIDKSASYVASMEQGRRYATPWVAHALAAALGLSADDAEELISAAERARDVEVPKSGARLHSNVLPRIPPLIGRRRERARGAALLGEASASLLTLTGPPGVGKTRLALQIALDLDDAFAGGVWFIDLSTVREPGLVIGEIARALGIREVGRQPLGEVLAQRLRDQSLLLILDNFEQVTAAAGDVATLLAATPGLKVIVTSRVHLNVRMERLLEVPPLTLPNPQNLPALEDLSRIAAVQLFVERARQANPTFTLNASNMAAVAETCIRLEGLPLAIELAAAWSGVLTPAEILRQLEQRLALLVQGGADLPERQRTMREAIAWSVDLVTPGDQSLFARLSVFVGGCTSEAAKAVGGNGEELAFLAGLRRLTEANLLQRAGDESPRFRMLETVRAFGLELLAAHDEEAAIRERHIAWHLRLVEEAQSGLTGPEQGVWLDRLEAEHANLLAALEWTVAQAQGGLGLRLAGGLWRFWLMHGYLSEGRTWLNRTLSMAADVPPPVRMAALRGAGVLAERQGDFVEAAARFGGALSLARELSDQQQVAQALCDLGIVADGQGQLAEAVELLEEALAIFRTLGDKKGIGRALNNLGNVLRKRRDLARAESLLVENLELSRELGDKHWIAAALDNLAGIAWERNDFQRVREAAEAGLLLKRELGDRLGIAATLTNLGAVASTTGALNEAVIHLEEALALYRELGSDQGVAVVLNNLAETVRLQGDLARAAALFNESLTLRRKQGDRLGIANILKGLGRVALDQGDLRQAGAYYGESLALWRAVGDEREMIACTEGIAMATHAADPARAARLLSAAAHARRRLGVQLLPHEQADHVHAVSAIQQLIEESAFAMAWRAGEAMEIDKVIRLALSAIVDSGPQPAQVSTTAL